MILVAPFQIKTCYDSTINSTGSQDASGLFDVIYYLSGHFHPTAHLHWYTSSLKRTSNFQCLTHDVLYGEKTKFILSYNQQLLLSDEEHSVYLDTISNSYCLHRVQASLPEKKQGARQKMQAKTPD